MCCARRACGDVPFQHSGYGYGHVTWLVFLVLFLGGRLTLRAPTMYRPVSQLVARPRAVERAGVE